MTTQGMRLTKQGKNLIVQGLMGREIKFTRVALGSGAFDYETEDVTELEEMRKWELDLPITELRNDKSGEITIVAYLSNAQLERGFFATEHAIFALNPETNEEILYAYRNAGDEFSYIPANTGTVKKNILLAFKTVVGECENITAVIDTSFAYLGVQEFREHEAKNEREIAQLQTAVSQINTLRSEVDADVYSQLAYLRDLHVEEATARVNADEQIKTEIREVTTEIKTEIIETVKTLDIDLDNFEGSDNTKAGKSGLVPAPPQTDEELYLRNDGTWGSPFIYIWSVPEITGTYIYNGSPQSPAWLNLDPMKVKLSGDFANITNAGDYVVGLTPYGKCVWTNGTQETLYVNWAINPATVSAVPTQNGTLTFNQAEQSPLWNNYDNFEVDISGDYQNKINAGTYTAKFTPNNNHVWTDKTRETKNVAWKIDKRVFAPVTCSELHFWYNGAAQTLDTTGFNADYMNRSNFSATDVGSYVATFSLKDKNNTTWTGGGTDDIIFNWQIERRILTAAQSTFTQNSVVTYTGGEVTFLPENFDADVHTISGNVQSSKGTYTATISLKDSANMKWSDGTNKAKTITWKIEPIYVTKPALNSNSFYYDAKSHGPTITNYDSSKMTKTGTESSTEVGNYTITFKLKSVSYAWTGGDTSDLKLTWKIQKRTFYADEINLYSDHTDGDNEVWWEPNLNFDLLLGTSYNSTYMEVVSGTTKATASMNLGTYSFTLRLKDPVFTQWNDGTTEDKTFTWKLVKSKIYLPVCDWTFTYNGDTFNLADYNDPLVNCVYFDTGSWHMQFFQLLCYDCINVSGTFSAKNVGKYAITVSLKNTSKSQWVDGTTGSKTVYWYITPENYTTVPTVNTLTFNGTAQEISLNNFDSSLITLSGTTKATNAGTYTAKLVLKDKTNCPWADGTTADKSITWTIAKCQAKDINVGLQVSWNSRSANTTTPKLTRTVNPATDTTALFTVANGQTLDFKYTNIVLDQMVDFVATGYMNGNTIWGFSKHNSETFKTSITSSGEVSSVSSFDCGSSGAKLYGTLGTVDAHYYHFGLRYDPNDGGGNFTVKQTVTITCPNAFDGEFKFYIVISC